MDKRFWMIGILVLMLASCGRVQTGPLVRTVSPDFFGFGEEIANQLLASQHNGFGHGEKIILTTLVDLDDLQQTSAFGRAMTEALSTCLFKRGFRIIEIRKTLALYIKKKSGELGLSRDTARLSEDEDVYGLITGTYVLTPGSVIVNIRMIEAASQEVLSVAGLEIERGGNINSLLARSEANDRYRLSAYER